MCAASYTDREAFIPLRRSDIVELCVRDGKLSESDVPAFRKFCEVLSAFTHFRYHRKMEDIKESFAPTDPDKDTRELDGESKDVDASSQQLSQQLAEILEGANYNKITQEELELAFREKSLIDLKTAVDFDDFEEMIAYQRGAADKEFEVKKLFKKKTLSVETYERVVILIRFKDKEHFLAKKAKVDQLQFVPGKTYIYLYKSIPRFDLELLFPNVRVSMTLKDKLLFGVPAIGASVPVLLKALPQILIIVGAILFFTQGPEAAQAIGADETQVRDLMPVLVALLSMTIGFGGLAFKQHSNYKSKRLKFLKNVTDTLFFRNLASNRSVLTCLVDDAEEEDCKEMILAYYHLLTHDKPLSVEALDDLVEDFLAEKAKLLVDFDIADPIEDMKTLAFEGQKLIWEENGVLKVPSIREACQIIDALWDNAYEF